MHTCCSTDAGAIVCLVAPSLRKSCAVSTRLMKRTMTMPLLTARAQSLASPRGPSITAWQRDLSLGSRALVVVQTARTAVQESNPTHHNLETVAASLSHPLAETK